MRLFIVAAAALLLSGCNLLVSETPLFQPGEPGTLRFRPGTWVTRDAECPAFNVRLPQAQWPACAQTVTVTASGAGDIITNNQPGQMGQPDSPVVLLGGAQPVAQALIRDSVGAGAYYFAGIDILARTSAGAVTSLRYWPIQCGPNPSAADAQAGHWGTRSPRPGLTMGEANCTTRDIAAVRAAATAGRADYEGRMISLEWVR